MALVATTARARVLMGSGRRMGAWPTVRQTSSLVIRTWSVVSRLIVDGLWA